MVCQHILYKAIIDAGGRWVTSTELKVLFGTRRHTISDKFEKLKGFKDIQVSRFSKHYNPDGVEVASQEHGIAARARV